MPKPKADITVETGTTDQHDRPAAPPPRRINVAVTPDMLAAIDRVIEREGVTLTEAVRRLIGYGEVLYRAAREDKQSIIFRGEDGGEREVLLV
jgi:hypothetical protein